MSHKRWILVISALLLGALYFFPKAISKKEILPKDEKEMIEGSTTSSSSLTASEIKNEKNSPAMVLSDKDVQKIQVLDDILNSRSDNDPRLDTEFKNMSEELRGALYKKYHDYSLEKRNERGTIAFLIAKDIKTKEDIQFLKSIYNENPCLSMESCSTPSMEAAHHSNTEQMTLNYPQIVVLYQLGKRLSVFKGNFLENDPMAQDYYEIINQAGRFPVPSIQQKADELKAQFKR